MKLTYNPLVYSGLDLQGTGGGGGGSVTSVAGGVGITNTPEPIVGAGTVDLDLFSLTTETLPVAGDWFAFVDVSVGTTPAAQRKVTLADLTTAIQAAGSLIDGVGVATRVAFWLDANTLSNDADLTWDSANNVLALAANGSVTLSDVGIARNAAGVLRITDGGAGIANIRFQNMVGTGSSHSLGTAGASTLLTVGQGAAGADNAQLNVMAGSGGGTATLSLANGAATLARLIADGSNVTIDYTGTLFFNSPVGGANRGSITGTGNLSVLGSTHTFGTVGTSTTVTMGQGAAGADIATLTLQGGTGGGASILNLRRGASVRARFIDDGTNTGIDYGGTFTLKAGFAGTTRVTIAASGETTILTGPARQLTLGSSGGGRSSFVDGAHAANLDYTLPAAITTSGFLKTDVGGALTWSLLTDADVPDTITISNLTQITTRLHSDLQNLVAPFDDHTQYLYLPGRAGGQSAFGGTASGDSIDFTPNTVAFALANAGRIRFHERVSFPDNLSLGVMAVPGTSSLIQFNSTYTLTSAVNLFAGVYFGPTLSYASNQVVCTIPAFWAAPNYAPSAAVTDGGATTLSGFFSAPTWNPTISGASTPLLAGYTSQPTTAPTTGTSSLARLTAYHCFPTFSGVNVIGTGASVTTLAGLTIFNPVVINLASELVGVDIATLSSGTLNLSIRSSGSSVQMRHAGPVVSGANAGPTTTSVGLELQSTSKFFLPSRMTTVQRDLADMFTDGMFYYNTERLLHQLRQASTWVDIYSPDIVQADLDDLRAKFLALLADYVQTLGSIPFGLENDVVDALAQ